MSGDTEILIADMGDEITILREQVEKLTKELFDYRREFKDDREELRESEQQLAALAEQNEKLREALVLYSEATSEGYSGVFRACCASRPEEPHTLYCSCNKALSLPDLATPVLNKYRAEGMRMAAEIVGPEDSYQDDWFKAKADSCAKLRAKADELEKINAAPFA